MTPTEIEKLNQLISRSDMTGNEKVEWLTEFIDKRELQLLQPDVSGSLQSLHEDLKGFQDMKFLTPDVKTGLGIAIEQVERYMRGDLEVREQ